MNSVISVLVPTRQRVSSLLQTLTALCRECADPAGLEVLLRVDLDDCETQRAISFLSDVVRPPARLLCLVAHRGDGWEQNHEYYNQLAKLATGDWLFMYGDDIHEITAGWDHAIRRAPTNRLLATTMYRPDRDLDEPHTWFNAKADWTFGNAFPVMPREMYNRLGCFSRHKHADVYLEWLTAPLGLQASCEVSLWHTPSTSQGDNAYWRDLLPGGRLAAQLAEDAKVLRDLL